MVKYMLYYNKYNQHSSQIYFRIFNFQIISGHVSHCGIVAFILMFKNAKEQHKRRHEQKNMRGQKLKFKYGTFVKLLVVNKFSTLQIKRVVSLILFCSTCLSTILLQAPRYFTLGQVLKQNVLFCKKLLLLVTFFIVLYFDSNLERFY